MARIHVETAIQAAVNELISRGAPKKQVAEMLVMIAYETDEDAAHDAVEAM